MILFDPEQSEAVEGFPGLAAAGDSRAALPKRPTLMRFLREAQLAVGLKGEVSVLLTTDDGIRGLNRRFRKKNKATDVLSFPVEADFGVAGDLAISVEHRLSVELRVLMLHGLLHLAGYDHEIDDGKMARKERRLRARLGLPMGLIERVDGESLREQKRASGVKQCAEKVRDHELRPSGAKAPSDSAGFMRGLKPPPPSVTTFSGVKTPVRAAAVLPGLKPRPTLFATEPGGASDANGTANSRDTVGSRRTPGSQGTASSRQTTDSNARRALRSRGAAR
jgi:probable rRNA maturation factor